MMCVICRRDARGYGFAPRYTLTRGSISALPFVDGLLDGYRVCLV